MPQEERRLVGGQRSQLADELFPTCHKLETRFALPPGSYATLVLKAAGGSPAP